MDNNYQQATQNNQATGWYYTINNERKGPVTAEEIIGLYNAGIIRADNLVWTQGLQEWTQLSKTNIFSSIAISPPPLSSNVTRNNIVWWLAFMPILGAIIEGFISALIGVGSQSLWFITLGLNILLCVLDSRNLQKAGYNTKQLGSSWIVPVYLFKRAKYLKQNYAYAIVWCVTFAILLFS